MPDEKLASGGSPDRPEDIIQRFTRVLRTPPPGAPPGGTVVGATVRPSAAGLMTPGQARSITDSILGKELTCYQLALFVFAQLGILIPEDFYDALRLFRVIFRGDFARLVEQRQADGTWPQLGDVVVIRNHEIVTAHLGVIVSEYDFLHAAQGIGGQDVRRVASVHRIDREPWSHKDRIAGFLRLNTT